MGATMCGSVAWRGAVTAMTLLGVVACHPEAAERPDPFSADTLRLEGPEIRIGAVDDPVYAFQTVTRLEVGPDGSVYTLHFNEPQVRRWYPGGTFAGTIGRQGEGPGEFTTPGDLGFFGEDTLWVVDRRAYRVHFFTPDGEFLGSVNPRVELGDAQRNPPRPERPLRDGTWAGQAPAWSREIATGELSSSVVAHMDAEGRVLDEVWRQRFVPHDVLAILREDGGGSYSRQPFGDSDLTAMTDEGLLVLHRRVWTGDGPAEARLTWISWQGDTVRTAAIPYTPVPLPSARVDSAVRAHTERMRAFLERVSRDMAEGAAEERIREAMYAPEYLPPARGMVVAEDGSVWVEHFDPEPEGRVWWILDPEGRPRATAVTPARLTVMAVTSDAVYGTERGEFDESYIVRYRIRRPEDPSR